MCLNGISIENGVLFNPITGLDYWTDLGYRKLSTVTTFGPLKSGLVYFKEEDTMGHYIVVLANNQVSLQVIKGRDYSHQLASTREAHCTSC